MKGQLWRERNPDSLRSQAIPEAVKGQLWRDGYTGLSGSQAIPTTVKRDILDTYSCEEKDILTFQEVRLYLKLGCGGGWSPHRL